MPVVQNADRSIRPWLLVVDGGAGRSSGAVSLREVGMQALAACSSFNVAKPM